MDGPKRLLILSCSQRKHPDPTLLPAIERYNGPQFQVLRKFMREYPSKQESLNVLILSAKFGLIPANEPIPDYDYKMTADKAEEMNASFLNAFKEIIAAKTFSELFVNLGAVYWQVLAGYEPLLPPGMSVLIAEGSLGRRQGQLRDWLYRDLPASNIESSDQLPKSEISLRGIKIALTADEIMVRAGVWLAQEPGDAHRFQSWYVLVNDQRVAPKWLVSRLTGLPVGSFHTGEANRVLRQLGIEVRRR